MSEPVTVVRYVFSRDPDWVAHRLGIPGYLTEDTARRIALPEHDVYRITCTIDLVEPTGDTTVDYCLNCNKPLARKGARLVHRSGNPDRCES